MKEREREGGKDEREMIERGKGVKRVRGRNKKKQRKGEGRETKKKKKKE